jgi:hypothetical protein
MYVGKDLLRPSDGFSDSTTNIPTLQQMICQKLIVNDPDPFAFKL